MKPNVDLSCHGRASRPILNANWDSVKKRSPVKDVAYGNTLGKHSNNLQMQMESHPYQHMLEVRAAEEERAQKRFQRSI